MINIKSVSHFVAELKRALESNFSAQWIEGEVSNLTRSSQGHLYFTLKDSGASLSVAMFRFKVSSNPVAGQLKNGDQVLVLGNASVYPARGSLQVICDKIILRGEGELKLKLEILKKKLAAEGLFDLSLKKEIPDLPNKIAVITSPHSAAAKDFVEVCKRRRLLSSIVIVPTIMQGKSSSSSVIKSLEVISSLKDIDLVVITRGGGSFEDLFSFNDESLVRVVHNYKLPIISAIGHEIDYTLIDYVADKRAETPTAAAESVTEYGYRISEKLERVKVYLKNKLSSSSKRIEEIEKRSNPSSLLGIIKNQFLWTKEKFHRLEKITNPHRLLGTSDIYLKLEDSVERLQREIEVSLNSKKESLEHSMKMLSVLGPQKVLERGYSIAFGSKGEILRTKAAMTNNTGKFKIRFQDGEWSSGQ